jgi:hypothetical protein
MIKDGRQYASSGGWGFGRFIDGKPVDLAQHETCFGCHEARVQNHDYVFTRYAVARLRGQFGCALFGAPKGACWTDRRVMLRLDQTRPTTIAKPQAAAAAPAKRSTAAPMRPSANPIPNPAACSSAVARIKPAP